MKSRLHSIVIAAGLVAAVASADAAGLSATASSDINTISQPDTQTYNTTNPADLATTHAVSSAITAYGSVSNGSVDATAGLVDLSAYSAVVNPFTNGCTNCAFQVSQQNNSSSVNDTLHVGSTTLAAGTPVDLLIGLSFSEAFSSSEAMSLYLKGGYLATLVAQGGLSGVQLSDDGVGPQVAIDSGVLHTFIGDTFALSAFVSGGTYAEFIDATARSIQWDATVRYNVDSQNPYVTLSADSGHDYATTAPVPEPSEAALLLAGLAFIAGLARRARGTGRQ